MIHFDDGTWTPTGGPLCPDLARSEWFGAADNRRGRFVLLFFRLLDRTMEDPMTPSTNHPGLHTSPLIRWRAAREWNRLEPEHRKNPLVRAFQFTRLLVVWRVLRGHGVAYRLDVQTGDRTLAASLKPQGRPVLIVECTFRGDDPGKGYYHHRLDQP